jgi:hypothetical protein
VSLPLEANLLVFGRRGGDFYPMQSGKKLSAFLRFFSIDLAFLIRREADAIGPISRLILGCGNMYEFDFCNEL